MLRSSQCPWASCKTWSSNKFFSAAVLKQRKRPQLKIQTQKRIRYLLHYFGKIFHNISYKAISSIRLHFIHWATSRLPGRPYISSTLSYISFTLGLTSSTLGYISFTLGYISSTLGYISSTQGYISSTLGYISSIN
jgi:hypothetical protein